MKKVVTVTIGLILLETQVFALQRMGPPVAGLEEYQSGFGLELVKSEMDVEVSGSGISETLADAEALGYWFSIIYTFSDFEGFVRLGVTEFDQGKFHGGTDGALGFGMKLTFAQEDATRWGGLFQMTWLEAEDTFTGYVPIYGIVPVSEELDYYEIQIAVGPTFEMEGGRVYGGPFLHFVDGDLDVTVPGANVTFDVEEKSEFGAYIGTEFDVAPYCLWNIEYQFTGDAWAIGTGLVVKQ